MTDLKEIFKKFSSNFRKDDTPPSSGTTENLRASTPNFQLGKRLSFYVDNDNISMISFWNLGFYRKLLKIENSPIPEQYITLDERNYFINNTIENFIKENGNIFTIISTVISGKETTFRNFLMPKLSKNELQSAIEFEVKSKIPFPEDNCVYDYSVCSEITTADQTQQKISLYASTKRKVLAVLSPLQLLSKTVDNIFHLQEVVGYLIGDLKSYSSEKTYIVLKISNQTSEISFFKNRQLQFFQTITNDIKKNDNEVDLKHLSNVADSISKGMRVAFDFYAGQFQESIDFDIMVYSDKSFVSDLVDILQNNTEYNFTLFPVEELNIEIDEEINSSLMLTSIPAIAASSCCIKSVNLLPIEQKNQKRDDSLRLVGLTVTSCIALLLIFGWTFLHDRIDVRQGQIEIIEEQIDTFRNSEAFHQYNNVKNSIIAHRSYLNDTKTQKGLFAANLKELSLLTPESIKLLHLDLRDLSQVTNMSLQGIVSSSTIPPEIILAEYIETLESSPFYHNIRIMRSVKKEIKKGFEIEFVIDMSGQV